MNVAKTLRVALILSTMLVTGGVRAVGLDQDAVSQEGGRPDVRALIDEGRYDKAEAAARGQPRTSGSAAEGADLLVEAMWRNGTTGPAALTLAQAAVEQADRLHGPVSLNAATSLRNLAATLALAGQYGEAIRLSRRRLDVVVSLGAGSRELCSALTDLGRVLAESGDNAGARLQIERALALPAPAGSQSSWPELPTLELSALLMQRRGDYLQARPLVDRVVRIREGRPEHPAFADALALLGDQFWFEGDVTQSALVHRRALLVAEATLRPDHPALAAYYSRLATPTLSQGNVDDTIALRTRALQLTETTFGAMHITVARYLNDLANVRLVTEDYLAARGLYERALAIYEANLESDSDHAATVFYNLAYLAGRLGDVAEVRRHVNRAASIWSRGRGADHQFVGKAQQLLGQTLLEQNQPVEAVATLTLAVGILERAVGPNHPVVASALGQLAAANGSLGRVREADALSARSVTIWENAQLPVGLAASLLARAEILMSANRPDEARTVYTRARDLGRQLYGPSHRRVAEAEEGLASALYGLGDFQLAFDAALDTETIARTHLRTVLRSVSERQATEYSGNRPTGLDLALSIAENTATASDARALLDNVIRSRALVLDELAARRHSVVESGGADLAVLWSQLASARQRLANLAFRTPDANRPGQYVKLLEAARREKEAAEFRLAERSAAFRADLVKADAGLNDVSRTLAPGAALVSFVRYNRSPAPSSKPSGRGPTAAFAAFVLSGAEPRLIQLGTAAAIETAVAAWRSEASLGALGAGTTAPQEARYRQAGLRLRRLIWDPVAPFLSGANRIFIVPDGALNIVSFASLPADGQGYLIDASPVIHHLSAERDLIEEGDEPRGATGLLALGGPAFTTNRARSAPLSAALRDTGTPCPAVDALKFAPLPGTLQEATEIAGLWARERGPGEQQIGEASLVVGAAADEGQFKRHAPGHRVLHLATHGFFLGGPCTQPPSNTRAIGGVTTAKPAAASAPRRVLPAGNPLLFSGLALAGANQRDRAKQDEDDGILTAEEIAAMNLEGTEWAVLSACDTGLGEIRAGEGVFGLRRAFQVAGVRTVIMSLWSVDDQATRQWMRALYEARLEKNLDTADSVRAASLNVLQDRRAKGLSTHPFYWAAFVAAGDWR